MGEAMSAAEAVPLSDVEYERLVESRAGEILGRFELRNGGLRRMSPEYSPHMRAKMRMITELHDAIRSVAGDLEVGSEGSVRFSRAFYPTPDVLVWRPSGGEGPIPGEAVRLIVEVAASSLSDDLGAKKDDYAEAGLAEYWVVDVNARALHRFSGLVGAAYRDAAVFREGEQVEAVTIPGLAITLTFPH